MKALGKDKGKTAQPSILSFFRAPSSLEMNTSDLFAPPTASQPALPGPTDKAAKGSARRQHSQARSRQRTADSKAGDDGDSSVKNDSVRRKKLRSSGPCGAADKAAVDGVLSDGHANAAAASLTSSIQKLLEVAQRQPDRVEGEAGIAGQGAAGETAVSMQQIEGRGPGLRLSSLDEKVEATSSISTTEPDTVICRRKAVSSEGPGGEEGRGESEEVMKESEDEDDSHNDGEDERDDGLTDLERYRLEQIRQNEEFLASLGLATLKASSLLHAEEGARKKPKRKRNPHSSDSVRPGPVRRSTRNRGGPVSYVEEGTGVDDAKVERIEEQEEEEVDYDDSTVLKYVCGPDTACASSAYDVEAGDNDDRKLRGFTCPTAVDDEGSVEGRLHDPTLSAVYSMHVRGRLLAAAGKQGRISIFRAPCMSRSWGGGEDEQESQGPLNGTGLLMSFRGHGGWVADVRWLTNTSEQPGNSTIRLISGGNDGVLKLWDVSKVAGGTPKTLASMRVHSKGVFSMDSTSPSAADGGDSCGSISSSGPTLVATGSKDATSALLQVTAADLQEVARIEGMMDSVIKCVRFGPRSSGRLLAMSGDDANVKVVDVRTRADNLSITSAHARTVHSVRWHPSEEHSILTAGFDPHLRLWDLRKPDSPVRTYFGHVSSLVTKQSSIHHPEFYGKGRYILTSGERSERLSIYETDTGVAVSRGKLWREISQVVALGGTMAPIVVADRHGVLTTMKPFFGSAQIVGIGQHRASQVVRDE